MSVNNISTGSDAGINGVNAVVNNRGVAKHVAGSSLLTNVPIATNRTILGGSVVVDGADTSGINTTDFGLNLAGGVTRRVTSSIAGVANTVLLGGSDFLIRRPIHFREDRDTLPYASGIRAGSWNAFSGIFDPALQIHTDSFGNDDAARPSRSIPGELAYQHGSTVPKQDDYKSKTIF